MDLIPSEELSQFRASVERLVASDYTFEHYRRTVTTRGSFDASFWKRIGDLGWLGACLPESAGGYAASPDETLVLLEATARGLVVEPILAGLVVPSRAVLAAAPDRAGSLLAAAAAGDTALALAWAEADRRYDLAPTVTRARRTGAGWQLSGRKFAVLGAPVASHLAVSAASEDGPVLLWVPAGLPGVALAEFVTVDGQRAADVVFDDVELGAEALLGSPQGGLAALEAAFDWGAAGAAAEAIGAMDAILAITLEYAKTRQQFGQTIGSLQVVQHRLAAMAVQIEYARSLLPLLSVALAGDAARRGALVSAAKWKIATAARHVAADGIQLHGGIGMTNEAAISHYFRKVQVLEYAYGDSRYHLARYRARRSGDGDLLAA
ncbi:acyl-CoA dehydrogenase family protein [Chelatococcus reniformis]|uniref:Acyl-CoA dehydrogenase short-chain specific n=1 Tax=Chelatococcus reniformis TaxID=1494448 RepID=A0A916UGJ9_9HYPH|nr:acyl-CoA dehydrogenase family protein [Chelatococcus reniformis]GGC72640.1 acyl-CoA dehydrogenase short-chain specific [Chelatococcus reniformis]